MNVSVKPSYPALGARAGSKPRPSRPVSLRQRDFNGWHFSLEAADTVPFVTRSQLLTDAQAAERDAADGQDPWQPTLWRASRPWPSLLAGNISGGPNGG